MEVQILKDIEKKEILNVKDCLILNNLYEKNSMSLRLIINLQRVDEKTNNTDEVAINKLKEKEIFILELLKKDKDKGDFFDILKDIIKLNPNNFTNYDFALIDGVVDIIEHRQYALSQSLSFKSKCKKPDFEKNLKDIENLNRIFEDLADYKIWNDRPNKISGLIINRDRIKSLKFVDSYLEKYKGKLTLL